MKPFIFSTVGVAVLGLIAPLPFVSSAQAETQSSDRFFCGTSRDSATGKDIPVTIARTPRGNVSMILWKSTFFATSLNDFTPQSRCQEVSRRFQSFYRSGTLSFLTTGKINGQNVICAAAEYGSPCKGLLLTLEPNDDPQKVLKDLLDLRTRARGPITRGEESTYIDVEEFLNTAPVQDNTLSIAPPNSASTQLVP